MLSEKTIQRIQDTVKRQAEELKDFDVFTALRVASCMAQVLSTAFVSLSTNERKLVLKFLVETDTVVDEEVARVST